MGVLSVLVVGLVLAAVTPATAATRHRIADSTGRTFATASTTDRHVTMQPPSGRANQVWELTLTSIGDRLTNVLTGGCLAVPANSTVQRPPVIQQPCQGTPYERWQRVQTTSTTVAFRNVGLQGRCMGIDPTSFPARLLAFPCNFGATNQHFRLLAP
ncbi:MAG TPA: RICIN domain-containing protein [Candidatus Limnocylindrales bacterium]|nr:RICIN domain-containing protein [Candidatus Limnocylindrales bacterium]